MLDALDLADLRCLPADLIALQRAADRAEAAFVGYVDEVSAELRVLHPGPEGLTERAVWPEAQAARLDELRAAYAGAVETVHGHPVIRRARARHRSAQALAALRRQSYSSAVIPAAVISVTVIAPEGQQYAASRMAAVSPAGGRG